MAELLVALHFDLDSGGFASVATDQANIVVKIEHEGKTTTGEWPVGNAAKIADAIHHLLNQ